jgi:hypothetical protein
MYSVHMQCCQGMVGNMSVGLLLSHDLFHPCAVQAGPPLAAAKHPNQQQQDLSVPSLFLQSRLQQLLAGDQGWVLLASVA